MEIQSANSIEDTIHNLYTNAQETSQSLSKLLKNAQDFVCLFNEYEISNPGQLSLYDYELFLLGHLIVNDTNNARLLWKRIPKQLKDNKNRDNAPLIDLWEIGKALTKQEYQQAFQLIEGCTNQFKQDSEKNGNVLKLIEVLTKLLREEHLIKMIQKAYSTIEFGLLQKMLGLQNEQKATVEQFLLQKGYKINGNYVNPPAEDSDKRRFQLNEERIDQLAQVVQFLEQQKHEFS